jgi:DNA modification methylase
MTPTVSVVTDLPKSPACGANFSFARLTRDKVTYATHGLHKYPAKFIPQLPQWALQYDDTTPRDVVLDPFCGSGTTLVEVGRQGGKGIGVDISPLACIISRAKCSILNIDQAFISDFLVKIESQARKEHPSLYRELKNNHGVSCLGMHYTWSNWFDADRLAGLLALRNAIKNSGAAAEVEHFALAVLSAITKSCSSLSEDQIKVRYDAEKKLSDPFSSFNELFNSSALSQAQLSSEYREKGAKFEIIAGSASNLSISSESVDRVITSPPYINAVDYTMAHKYNMFVLGALDPDSFKDHCREYIGVTERAVRAVDMLNFPRCDNSSAKSVIDELLKLGTATARNRAYVVSQYFSEMKKSFEEGHRVLKMNGLYFLVVGENNRICGITVPTADILESIANSTGLDTEKSFFHVMANRSAMRFNRAETGGSITREKVYVFRKR